jgi:hypothetical protein
MNQKPFLLAATAAMVLGAGLAWPSASSGQATASPAAIDALIAEVAAQQTVIVENQVKIETKLAAAAEDIRVARIFIARGGGKAK